MTPNNDQTASTETGQEPQNKQGGCLSCVCKVLIWIVIIPIFVYILVTSCIRFCCCCCCCSTRENSNTQTNNGGSFSDQLDRALQDAQRFTEALKNIRSCLAILSLLWLTLNLSVPGLKSKFLYGSELWKWSLLLAMLCCGYNLISPATNSLMDALCNYPEFKAKENAVYFAKGLQPSVNLIVLSGSVLLTWIFYFQTSSGIKKTSETDEVLHIGTWSFGMLFVGAVLWLLKNILLLEWEKDAVYRRVRERILRAGFQFYFVGLVCGWHSDLFQPSWIEKHRKGYVKMPMDQDKTKDQSSNAPSSDNNKPTGRAEDKNKEVKEAAKKVLIDPQKRYQDVTMDNIKDMTKYFVALLKVYSSREDDESSDVLENCEEITPSDGKNITEQDLLRTSKMEEKDAKILIGELKDEHRSNEISRENFQKWMVKAFKNCLALGRTLSDAREVVKVLDNVMTSVLIAIVIIAWLLLTDIANTKILVLIASPFVGATFMFGNTCKTVFEGIIFSFIGHPFDVGDRCIIDGVELEVKRMGILTTTFKLIETKKEALYPNSELASKPIINLKWEPDPNDHVELKMDCSWTKVMLDKLQTKINEFLENDNRFEKADTNTVVIKEIGDSIRMKIQYRNVLRIEEGTHSQCHEKKRNRRTELFFKIKEFMDDIKVGEKAEGENKAVHEGTAVKMPAA